MPYNPFNRGEAKMGLFQHLNELRKRLTKIIIVLLVAVCALYFFSPTLINFLLAPVSQFFQSGVFTIEDAVNATASESSFAIEKSGTFVQNPLEGFSVRFVVSLFFGVIVTSPFWIFHLLAFFLPALKPAEKKWVLPTFFIGCFLFIIGTVFCYLIILEPAFQWMLDQTKDFAMLLPAATSYIDLVMLFEIGFGVAFELPLVVFYLQIFNVLSYKKLRKSWRVVYIVLMLVSALVTPDASPITMILMFAALAMLYEASLFAAKIALSRRKKAQTATDVAEADNKAETDDAVESPAKTA